MYSDCNTLDESCTTCISGEKRCEPEEKGTSLIFSFVHLESSVSNYIFQMKAMSSLKPGIRVTLLFGFILQITKGIYKPPTK